VSLLGIAHVTAVTFTTLASITGNVDATAAVAFLTAVAMTVATYVAVPALATLKLGLKI